MSIFRIPPKVKLVISFFSSETMMLDKAEKELSAKFGTIDYMSDDFEFSETDYYKEEMGENLKTRFVSFKRLQDKNDLVKIKHFCCKLEKKYSVKYPENPGKNNRIKKNKIHRQLNIDPGFLSLENFILATGKGYSHRIYLDKGVWADLTLIYRDENFIDLDWTYLNYRNDKIKKVLLEIRKIYKGYL